MVTPGALQCPSPVMATPRSAYTDETFLEGHPQVVSRGPCPSHCQQMGCRRLCSPAQSGGRAFEGEAGGRAVWSLGPRPPAGPGPSPGALGPAQRFPLRASPVSSAKDPSERTRGPGMGSKDGRPRVFTKNARAHATLKPVGHPRPGFRNQQLLVKRGGGSALTAGRRHPRDKRDEHVSWHASGTSPAGRRPLSPVTASQLMQLRGTSILSAHGLSVPALVDGARGRSPVRMPHAPHIAGPSHAWPSLCPRPHPRGAVPEFLGLRCACKYPCVSFARGSLCLSLLTGRSPLRWRELGFAFHLTRVFSFTAGATVIGVCPRGLCLVAAFRETLPTPDVTQCIVPALPPDRVAAWPCTQARKAPAGTLWPV